MYLRPNMGQERTKTSKTVMGIQHVWISHRLLYGKGLGNGHKAVVAQEFN